MLIAIAASSNLSFEGAYVNNAYLYGKLDIPITMEQPTESSQQLRLPGHVLNLINSMYVAEQAGKIWVSVLHQALHQWGFTNSCYD